MSDAEKVIECQLTATAQALQYALVTRQLLLVGIVS
jgi:hypothetical protein